MARPDAAARAGRAASRTRVPDGGLRREARPRGAIARRTPRRRAGPAPGRRRSTGGAPGAARRPACRRSPWRIGVGRDLVAHDLVAPRRHRSRRRPGSPRTCGRCGTGRGRAARPRTRRRCRAVEDDRRQRRVAAAEALAQAHDVRPRVEELRGEHGAEPPERRDDLVEDQQDPVAVAQLAQARQVARRRDHDPGRHQDRLGDQGRDGPRDPRARSSPRRDAGRSPRRPRARRRRAGGTGPACGGG